MVNIYICKTRLSAAASAIGRTRPLNPGLSDNLGLSSISYRRKYINVPVHAPIDAQNFITTVINRMSMPDTPTESKNKTEFKFMYDQFYRVILHYTNWPEDSNGSVARRVKMAVPVLTLKDCEVIVKQTSKYGICIVCTVQQDKATLYRDALLQAGLNATLEEA